MSKTTIRIQVGDRVCRTGEPTVGTVVWVGDTSARVAWPTRRINGTAHRTCLSLDSLTPAAENLVRTRTGPADADWRVTAYTVACDHPSGRWESEDGVNAFRFGPGGEAAAAAKAAELTAAGRTAVRVSRQEVAEWVPAKCRTPRTKFRWARVVG